MMGAAWATVLSYGVMAAVGAFLSHRIYPLPLEWGRLVRLAVAAAVSFALSRYAPAALLPALGVKAAAFAAFPALLALCGFLAPSERERLRAWMHA
jgi:hypothetical protein